VTEPVPIQFVIFDPFLSNSHHFQGTNMNQLSTAERVSMVQRLVDGCPMLATFRITGVARNTIDAPAGRTERRARITRTILLATSTVCGFKLMSAGFLLCQTKKRRTCDRP